MKLGCQDMFDQVISIHVADIQSLKPPLDEQQRRAMNGGPSRRARTSTQAMIGYSQVICSVDVAPLLSSLKVPARVLASTQCSAARLSAQRAMASDIPGARLAVVDSRGHATYWDRRGQCIAAWRAHVAGIM